MSSELDKKIEILKSHVKEYPNFPKDGVLFRDIFSIFENPQITKVLFEVLVEFAQQIKPPVECVAGLDARGFLLGPVIAQQLNIPFVPIRKRGKLPGTIVSITYDLEYGQDTLEIQQGPIKQGQRVLLVDDLIATGGSLNAGCKLVGKVGGKVAACLVLLEIVALKGRANILTEVLSIIKC